jgi:hypothetical protein
VRGEGRDQTIGKVSHACLEVWSRCHTARLDAVGAVLLDGLSYWRAGRMVGVSKTEVGDSIALLLGETAKLGSASPTGPS